MGFSPFSCLQFDEACRVFVEEWERRRDATKQVPVPSGKHKPTMPAPLYSPQQLLGWLGIDAEAMNEAEGGIDPSVEAMANAILRGEADWLTGVEG